MKRGEFSMANLNNFKFDLQRFAAIENTLTFDSYSNHWVNTHRAIDMPGLSNEGHGDHANQLAITTTNISIFSNDMRIGFVQSFNVSESRDIQMVQELGTEGVVQAVPGNTRGGQIQLQRTALYNSDMWNALGLTPTGKFIPRTDSKFISGDAFKRQDSGTYGNPFRTLKDQRVPLEIRAHTILPNVSEETRYVEFYYDAWISSYQKTISVQQIWISESVTLEYGDMSSQVVAGANPHYY